MFRRLVLVAIIWQMLAPLTGAGSRPLLAAEVSEPSAPSPVKTEWQLLNARVLRPGEASETSGGTLSSGYTIEADAAAVGEAPFIQKGIFRLIVTTFSPKEDQPGQKAGRWYVQGSWILTGPVSAKLRHAPSTIRGELTADLPFDPTKGQGELLAQVKVPRVPPPSRWVAGEGTFAGNERFEGKLTLTIMPRPEMVQRKGRQP